MSRAAAEIDPVCLMLSSNAALPGPILAPDSNTMLSFTLGITHQARYGRHHMGRRVTRLLP
jgi:hypothetical protein